MLGVMTLLAACGESPKHAPYWSQIRDVGSWMTGAFLCESPVGGEGETQPIRLDIVEFWPGPNDSGVLYAEWAPNNSLGQPLRQQVFHVQRFKDGSAALLVFDLRDPERYAGAWREPKRLATLKKDGLIERPECLIRLVRESRERFVGETMGTECPGPREEDAYSVTRLEITPSGLVWATRGFDSDGRQVSGHTAEGDAYVKIVNYALR